MCSRLTASQPPRTDHLFAAADLARLSGVPLSRVLALVRLGAAPCWTADSPNSERRWAADSLIGWGEILAGTGLD